MRDYISPAIDMLEIDIEGGIAASFGESGQAGGKITTGDDDLNW